MTRKIVEVSSKFTAKNGATKWRNCVVGSAFVYDDGNISLQLDPGVSISSIEGVRITIKEPFKRDYQQPQAEQQKAASDDEIPF